MDNSIGTPFVAPDSDVIKQSQDSGFTAPASDVLQHSQGFTAPDTDVVKSSPVPNVSQILQQATTPTGQEPSWKTAADAHIQSLESGHDWVQGHDGTWTKQQVRPAGPLSISEKLAMYYAYQNQQGYGQAPMAEPGQAEAAAQAQGQQNIVANQGAFTNASNAAEQNLAAFGTNLVGAVAPQYASQLQQNVQAAAPYDPDSKAGFVGGVVGGTLPLVPAMLAGPEGAAGLQLATAGTAGVGQFGNVREQVQQQRAQGQQISTKQELTDAALQAAIMFAAQKFGLSNITGEGGALNLPSLTAVERKSMVNVVEQAVAKHLTNAGVTGGDFAAMQLANNTVNRLTGVNPKQDLMEGVPQAFGAGAITGVAGTALHGMTGEPAPSEIPVPSQETIDSLKTGKSNGSGNQTPAESAHAVEPQAAAAVPPPATDGTTAAGAGNAAKTGRPLIDAAEPSYRIHQGANSLAVPLEFESPEEKALYLATVPRKGKVANEAINFLQDVGFKPEDIERYGDEVRGRIDGLAKQPPAEGHALHVPALEPAEAAPKTEAPQTAVEQPANASQLPSHEATLNEYNPGAKRVDASTLPPEHQEVLNDYKALTGKDMIPYSGGKGRGFHVDGDAYYSVDRNNTPQQRRETIAHEATHQLQDTRPDLVNALDKALPDGMRKQLLDEYQRLYTRQEGKPLSTDQHNREIQAMAVGRAFSRPSVADAVMERNPGVFSRAAGAILGKLRGLTSSGRATNEIIKFLQAAKARSDQMEMPASRRVGESDPQNFLPSPHDRIRDEAEEYTRKAGIPYEPDTTYAPLNEQRAKQIASDYGSLKHEPTVEPVKKSYDAFKQETMDQYHYLQDKGIKFEPWTKPGQPYANSEEMMRDARDNKHLYFFQGGELPADHPLAGKAPGTQYSYNDIFRAVHDYFGHAKEGYGFGPRGEENAWRQHSQLYSEEARPAMTTETRGQNSWVNFGPHGEHNQANPQDTIYAEQKAGLMNPAYGKLMADSPLYEGDTQSQHDALKLLAKDKAGYNLPNQKGADFLPGGQAVNTFANEDVKPALTRLADNFREAWDGLKGMIAPQTRSEGAGIVARLMRERGGTLARGMDKIHAAFDETEKALDKLPVDQQRAITDAAERGEKQADPALQPVADAIRQMYDDRLGQLQKLNPDFAGLNDYMGHLYKDPNRAAPILETLMRKNMEGSKGFLRKRSIPFQSDAIEKGLEPVTDNPVSMMKLKLAQMDKYITTQNVMNDLKDQGLMQRVPARKVFEREQDGYARIDDKVGTIFAPPNRKGGISVAGYWMAPEPVARVINNHLSPGLRDSESIGGMYKTYLAVGHAMNSAQLLSGFHGLFSTVDTMASKMSLGMRQAWSGDFKGAGKSLASWATILGPVIQAYRNGSGLLKEWNEPGSTGNADLAKAADMYQLAGGRAHMGDEYGDSWIDSTKNAAKKGNYVGAALRSPFALIEAAAHPLMGHLIPRLKAGVFYDMAMHEVEHLPSNASRDDVRKVMSEAQDSVDDRLGEMVYDNMFWDRTFKDLTMATTRSVGWNAGTFRTFGGAAVDLAKLPGQIVANKGLNGVRLSNRLAYAVAVPATTALVGSIAHYLATGQPPQTMKDAFFPKTGKKTKQGDDERWAIPSYAKDLYEYGRDISDTVSEKDPTKLVRTLSNKTHPVLDTMLEMLKNHDYYGTKIRNEDDPILKQLGDVGKFLGKQVEPFGVRGVSQMMQEGQGARSLLPLVGLNPARRDITESPAALQAQELVTDRLPHGVRTQAQADKSREIGQLAAEVHNKEPDVFQKIRAAVEGKQITSADFPAIRNRAKYGSTLERNVHALAQGGHLDAAMQVFDTATDDEKRKLMPILTQAVRGSKTTPVEARKQYMATLSAYIKSRQAPQGVQ